MRIGEFYPEKRTKSNSEIYFISIIVGIFLFGLLIVIFRLSIVGFDLVKNYWKTILISLVGLILLRKFLKSRKKLVIKKDL